jgi:Tfp pilus assembly protein PilF
MRLVASLALLLLTTAAGTAADSLSLEGSTLLAIKGRVEIARAGSTVWDPAQTNLVLNAGDQLRTLESSRATFRLRDATIVNISELTTLRLAPESGRSVIDLLRGVLSFFHRDQPGDAEVRGGTASAIIRGTEFVASVDADQKFTLLLFAGRVEVTNQLGRIAAASGEIITASAKEAPRASPSLAGMNRAAIQWTLYYPSVLDPVDLSLSERWQSVLNLYQRGELWRAAEAAQALGNPATDAEQLFQAALRMAVGDIAGMRKFSEMITPGSREARLRVALEDIVRAVQFQPCLMPHSDKDRSTTEWLAASFCYQSQGRLSEALVAARKSVVQSSDFGFAQARVAELEFDNGNISAARTAIQKALRLSPGLASAVALDGFLLAAQGRFVQAGARFDQAITLDSALGDAWLGRGLIRFRQGDRIGGRTDIEAAAATEPQRSILRSYLGKALAEEGSDSRALSELEIAELLDSKDPTALLYSALIRYRNYDLAGAIRDLDESTSRNTNRSVFRSQMLLDQDAAVRSANLANIYELADMSDLARRESARAVMFDYSDYSGHLNLAGSFNALRDPTRFNLRNETVWFNEHLLSTLLAPVDAAPLSQNLSQNEYSRLFARDRIGFSSSTEYFGNGELRQLASQFGNFSGFSYALDLDSDFLHLDRPNQDLTRIEWYSRAKIEISPADSLLLLTKYEDFDSGDNFQYADQTQARPSFRFRESQTPLALAGYHHEWNPGSHTLLLGGRLESAQHFSDRGVPQLIAFSFPEADPVSGPFDVAYENKLVIYSAEVNQILESESHTTILGGRYQNGKLDATASLDDTPLGPSGAGIFGGNTDSVGVGNFQRASIYLYHTWEILTDLRLTGGLSYDDITSPVNFRRPPLESGEISRNHLSPKAALIYSPNERVTLRGIYAESLGGVSLDESVTLEPTQLAGFPQSFRTLISESIAGSVEVPRHDVGGIALDVKLPTQTFLSAEGTFLQSGIERRTGIFDFDANLAPAGVPSGTDEKLRYQEHGVRLSASQILAEEWFLNGIYQFTRADLDRDFPVLPATPGFARTQNDRADLHRSGLSLLYQRKDGWFARGMIAYLHQQEIDPSPLASEDLVQLNLFAGWRFPRVHGDITVGVLNLTGSDYHLNPLTPYEEFPRERTFYCRFRLNL